ncbi:uncharacterized protein EV420DRAFT_566082 [Desarmillaria tabescens]|uniref:Uncharacterized protein n=1 Tax=Armillaria tabescens TaxID=1929756 RepID=A0AA39N2T0_ARMTA|nr:uncharacterized protein EV420DRAFT_1208441 [Desarmillaria tabescens]XP_060328898.1 uncharacterized protein EV420DRAFT_566082 [Desarmillaria tabescens]KAK0438697.1 hypothetical protein EV420DRAFT_1208441 [Desarmillaria tabescens]KAK0455388.1 hypothetical protein EV420DRAFT_566082 [Desarmillaria tabescens]
MDLLTEFLEPILSFLKEQLPPPVYSFIISMLSHCLAFCTAFYTLVGELVSTNPLQWDAQTLLPPLIAVFSAYIALMSLYRTTSWMLRTSFWFIKWGTIVAALIGASGWVLGSQQLQANKSGGLMPWSSLGEMAMDMLNSPSGQTSKRKPRTPPQRPRVWESFDRHRAWQETKNEPESRSDFNAKEVIGAITRWWDMAMDVMADGRGQDDGNDSRAKTTVSR